MGQQTAVLGPVGERQAHHESPQKQAERWPFQKLAYSQGAGSSGRLVLKNKHIAIVDGQVVGNR